MFPTQKERLYLYSLMGKKAKISGSMLPTICGSSKPVIGTINDVFFDAIRERYVLSFSAMDSVYLPIPTTMEFLDEGLSFVWGETIPELSDDDLFEQMSCGHAMASVISNHGESATRNVVISEYQND